MSQLAEKQQPVQVAAPSRSDLTTNHPGGGRVPPRQDATVPFPGWKGLFSRWSILNTLALVFTLWYALEFYAVIRPFWFHHAWTTDDALQQVYPFHEAITPGVFEGDLITDVMVGYLAPAHYWLCYFVTTLTGDPVMMSHWVMLIQVALTLGFLFCAVRYAAGTAPALLAVTWLLHTRYTMQRLTGGLPRGWSGPIFAAFLFFALKGNHTGVLATIFLGCLLNPPATMVVAVAYGITLIWRWLTNARGDDLVRARRRLLSFVAISPVFLLLTLAVVYRPPSVGQMVSYDVAASMPEFSRPSGRFPFIPFSPAIEEMRMYGLQAFIGRFHHPGAFIRECVPYVALGGLILLSVVGRLRRRVAIPGEILFFGVGALTVYFLSRELAFRLYVPNRHLQVPLAIFFISAFTIGAWRAFHRGSCEGLQSDKAYSWGDTSLKKAWPSAIALLCLVGFVAISGGMGLAGTLNFNYSADKHGGVFQWLKKNSPQDALIAGHPTHIDATQLFAARRAYVTTETTHPFYTRYYAEMKRRTEIALRAHYSRDLTELLSLLEPEGVDYFVFKRAEFKGDTLRTLSFFPPFDSMMKELVSRPREEYAFRALPARVDLDKYPYVPYIDRYSVVVDLSKLREALAAPVS